MHPISVVKSVAARVAGYALALAVILQASAVQAQTLTLPDTGVDTAEYCTLFITTLGGTIAVCLGGYLAFLLIKVGMVWIRRFVK